MTLLKVFFVLVLCVVGVGFYRGWFVVGSEGGDDESGRVELNLTMDPEKAKDDARALETKAREMTGNASEEPPSDPSHGGPRSEDAPDLEDE